MICGAPLSASSSPYWPKASSTVTTQQGGGQKPREPARLVIGQIDQPRRRVARAQQDPHDDAGGSPRGSGHKNRAAAGRRVTPTSGQPMPAVEKHRREHHGADRVAEQQGKETGQRRAFRAQAHPSPHAPAQLPDRRLFDQHRERTPPAATQPTLTSAPSAEPSRSNERQCRASAPGVSGSMLMSDIASCSRRIAKCPSGPTELISHRRCGVTERRTSRRKTACRVRRVRPRRGQQQEQQNHERGRDRTGEPVRPRRESTAKPHAAGFLRNRRRLCLLACSPQAGGWRRLPAPLTTHSREAAPVSGAIRNRRARRGGPAAVRNRGCPRAPVRDAAFPRRPRGTARPSRCGACPPRLLALITLSDPCRADSASGRSIGSPVVEPPVAAPMGLASGVPPWTR